jgi:pimeloyl-ACP methyl ester carboxylesterase
MVRSNFDVQTHRVRTRDAEIEYYVQGTGAALVILPSLGRGAADYDELATLLARDGLQIIRPQPRGIGGSTGQMHGLSMHDLAADVAAVIRDCVGGPAAVAGHAFGNFVARMLATTFPDTVRAVALVAASAGKLPSGESPYDPAVHESVYKSGDLSLPVDERIVHLKRAFFAPGNDVSSWLEGWHPATKAMQKEAQAATPIENYFGCGTTSVFDLQAAEDTVAPRRHAHVLREALGARVTVQVIERAGHALIPEQVQAVRDALVSWMRSLGAVQWQYERAMHDAR